MIDIFRSCIRRLPVQRTASRLPFLRQTHSGVSPAITLRPYQEECISACLKALSMGISRIGVSMPTGAGKTTVFVSLLDRIQPTAARPEATKSLIIVNTIELAKQAAECTHQILGSKGVTVEIEQGQKHKASGVADVTVGTFQTLMRGDRLGKFSREHMKAIIVDEAHHAAAKSYMSILSHFDSSITSLDPDEPSSGVPIIGFSATFGRHDGLALGAVFDHIVYHHELSDMIRDKWLCEARFTTVSADIDLTGVKISVSTGDFTASSLAHIINTQTVNDIIVKSWLDLASTRKSTLVFCVNLAHVHDLANKFREAGIDARYLHARTPMNERQGLLDDFRAGKYPVLVNCAILTEGADVPNIDCVLIARPTRSRNVFAQMIGRGMRKSPATGKDDCHIIDFVDARNRFNGLFSTPHLLGLNPNMIQNKTLEELEAIKGTCGDGTGEHESDDVPEAKSITYKDWDNPWVLLNGGAGQPHIGTISQFSWVHCRNKGGEVYVLECPRKGTLKIVPFQKKSKETNGTDAESDARTVHHEVFFNPIVDNQTASTLVGRPERVYRRKVSVLVAQSLEEAVRGADLFVGRKLLRGFESRILFRNARWRFEPATPSQIAFLSQRKQAAPFEGGKGWDPTTLTKGEAANLITRFKHGVQAYYEKKMVQQEKAAKAIAKEQHKVNSQVVRVGPLHGSRRIKETPL